MAAACSWPAASVEEPWPEQSLSADAGTKATLRLRKRFGSAPRVAGRENELETKERT